MEHDKEILKKAVDYAIGTHYEVHNRQFEVRRELYKHKNICVFGTGEFFRDCATEEYLTRFEYVSDNDPSNWGKLFKGRRCLSPQEIVEMGDHYLSDLWEVPRKIKSLYSGYQLYLCHHAPVVWDTDLCF